MKPRCASNSKRDCKAQESIDEQVETKLKAERQKIVDEESKKARRLLSADLEKQAKELAELQEVLADRDTKLAAAQKAQAELIRKQRELDDAKREMDLTIEKKVQESLLAVRDKAKLEAEEGLKLKVAEKEELIAGHAAAGRRAQAARPSRDRSSCREKSRS